MRLNGHVSRAVARLNADVFTPDCVPGTTASLCDKEAELHAAICETCDRLGWLYFHGAMSRATHRTLGEPDFIICADGGRVLLVECKTRTGKLSPDQRDIAAHAAKLGHTVHVVRSVKEFQQLALQSLDGAESNTKACGVSPAPLISQGAARVGVVLGSVEVLS